jgi:hypothetical protein
MKQNTAELKENTLSAHLNIFQEVVHQVLQNVFTRCESCLHAEGCHLKLLTVVVRIINIILHSDKKCNLLFYQHEERLAISQLLCWVEQGKLSPGLRTVT